MARCAVLVLAMTLGCSGSTKKDVVGVGGLIGADAGGIDAPADPHIPRLAGPARLIDGLYFVDEGAPDPLACKNDRDCIGDTVPDDSGCCVRSSEPTPQTWVWHTWMTERRLSSTCDEVKCPPLPVSGMPDLCKLEVKCDSGRCAGTCQDAAMR